MKTEKESTATVVKNTGSRYMLSKLPEWKLFPAIIRGRMRMGDFDSTNPVAIGDRVEYYIEPDGECVITSVLPRRNYIIRKSTNLSRQSHIIASNIDMAFLVVTVALPEIKLPFVDRYLVTCEAYGIPVVILLNKADVLEKDAGAASLAERFVEIYGGAGYDVLKVSIYDKESISAVMDRCRGKLVLFSGQSGVGKSSLIKLLSGSADIKVLPISSSHLQGKHTTTFYEMYPFPSGGFAIDSPGLRSFGLVDLDRSQLSCYFPEMRSVMDNCRFMPCSHTHEPGCAVKKALEEGKISRERYDSYLGMLLKDEKYR
ncbi:MAG: ribosome small subunit-dependent GTPase A [Bacteroidales bacterium]|nr:ribosome small subunit-dependent GTPase A [Bacteroidales bacterium]